MTGRTQILVACSDPEGQQALSKVLFSSEFELVFSSGVSEARAILARGAVALVLCAAELRDGCFHDMLREVKQKGLNLPVIVASRSDDVKQYLDAMDAGAFDYIARPYRRSEVEHVLRNALRRALVAAA